MITELSAQNFKSWENTGQLQIAPLTAFFGANSSGKTSIFQTLLMLKQTAERPPDWNGVIDFGDEGSVVNLSNFNEVIHRQKSGLSVDISVSWQLPEKLVIGGGITAPQVLPRPSRVPIGLKLTHSRSQLLSSAQEMIRSPLMASVICRMGTNFSG